MALHCVPIPAFEDNYIWAIVDGTTAAIVDPGDAAPVLAWCAANAVRIGAIVLTHHHDDHVGGVAALLASERARPGLPVLGSEDPRVPHVTRRLRDGDVADVEAPRMRLRVLEVPGHTLGHIAYVQDAEGDAPPRLFCGDTLFASGCGRLFEGTPAQMLRSLDRLAALDPATEVFCAHEYTLSNIEFSREIEPANPEIAAWREQAQALRAAGRPTLPTTIGHERRVNPFLRAGEPAVQATLAADYGFEGHDRLAAFALLRSLKNLSAAARVERRAGA